MNAQRTIYPHWLDPDYSGKLAIPKDDLGEQHIRLETLLKMHALAGDCLHINEVQLVESRTLLRCFADAGFRAFLDANPDFLRLVTTPDDRLGAKEVDLGRVCSGLAKLYYYGDSYVPNTFDDRTPIRAVAETFRGVPTIADAMDLFSLGGQLYEFIAGYRGSDSYEVAGLYYALRHFIHHPSQIPHYELNASSTYYEELNRALANVPNDSTELKRSVERTINLASTPEEKFRRSLIVPHLSKINVFGHPDRVAYLTIAQAWNVAVGRRMHSGCQSAFCFRDTFPIAIHSGLATGRTTFTGGVEKDLFEMSYSTTWHPSQLRWETIAKVRSQTASEVSTYQRTLSDPRMSEGVLNSDDVSDSYLALARSASKIVAEERVRLPAVPKYVSGLITLGTAADKIADAVFFGHAQPQWKDVPSVAVAAYNLLRDASLKQETQVIGEALYIAGLQYNLHGPAITRPDGAEKTS